MVYAESDVVESGCENIVFSWKLCSRVLSIEEGRNICARACAKSVMFIQNVNHASIDQEKLHQLLFV
jgi:hypothetical protein